MENGHLIQAVATYTGAIEKRLKDLETRVGELEKKLNASQAAEAVQQDLIDELEQRIAELEARPMAECPEETENETEQTIDEGENEEVPTVEAIAEETATEETEEELMDDVTFFGVEEEPAQKTEQPTESEATTEPIAEPAIEPTEETTVKTEVYEAKVKPQEATSTETTAPMPVAEKVADKPAEAPKTTAYGKPVSDLAKAISIGDRFLFQRELFDKNAELMQRTIADLNGLSTFGEAVEYLQQHFDWDKELQSYELFMTALHRRFGE